MTCDVTSSDFIANSVMVIIFLVGCGWIGLRAWRVYRMWRDLRNCVVRPYYDDYPDSEFRL